MIAARIAVLLALAAGGRAGRHKSGCGLAPRGGFPWNYQNFGAWEDLDGSFCGEEDKQQSPIDLSDPECENGSNKPQVRKNKKTWRAKVINDGRTLKLMFDCYNQVARNGAHGPVTLFFSDSDAKRVKRSPADADFDLAELHFHWGQSEHAIEGERSPAEAHFKFKHSDHRGTEYRVAKMSEGALRAVGILLDDGKDDEGDNDSKLKFPIFGLDKKIKRVRRFNASFRMTIKVKPLKKLLEKALKKVYKYVGSLTTPPCTLKLPWMVSEEVATVKPKLLTELRKLRDETGQRITRNYRPLQKHTDELKLCLQDGEEEGCRWEEGDTDSYHY